MKIPRDELSKCKLVTDEGEVKIELGITDDSPSIDFKVSRVSGSKKFEKQRLRLC